MSVLKRTYALAAETVASFERAVPQGRRSSTIESLVRDWLDGHRRAELRREVVEGCREMSDVLLELERESHPLEEEVERVLARHPARRRRPRAARSRRRV